MRIVSRSTDKMDENIIVFRRFKPRKPQIKQEFLRIWTDKYLNLVVEN